jgi:NitT/TauT family transport system substrate-binding protein
MKRQTFLAAMLGLITIFTMTGRASAELDHVAVAREWGLAYLPVVIMQHDKLLEKNLHQAGLDNVKVTWKQFGGGAAMTDALLSGHLQFANGGWGPLIKLWAKTRGRLGVKAVCANDTSPQILVTRNPKIKTVKDFTSADRIALPAVKVSTEAVVLQMAIAKEFGFAHYAKLDNYTVSMKHPDALLALTSGRGEVTADFTLQPYAYEELQHPGIHQVLTSDQVLGGDATLTLVWATTPFRDKNPEIYGAFVAAMKESMASINADKHRAAKAYMEATGERKLTADQIYNLIKAPGLYTMTPKHMMDYADFLYKTKAINVKPKSWKDLVFPNVYNLPGS